uniref:Uncharacterized protein n=1 Tax=Kwoniella bestiolae CBS 10118 TaxID=1296100 RepID=A0A1B9GG96_9TREE|nr:hypothetical protein I302_01508 [Kwoniella bestiolae CBS 10118]OCF29991.1 hypothetical protein I302_01508 [Kwoniella bestiolae CBS 10118]
MVGRRSTLSLPKRSLDTFRPSNWATNTAICVFGIGLATFGVWRLSASKEQRHIAPTRPIPSQRVSNTSLDKGLSGGEARDED